MIAGKDLRIERRSKVGLGQIAPFALTVLLLFAFAVDPDRGLLSRLAPGLFWVTVLLSSVLAVQRTFAAEFSGNSRDGFKMLGLEPAAVFTGKAAAVAVQLIALEVVLAFGVYVLYDVPVRGVALLLAISLCATIGLAATGTLYGALCSGGSGRETLLPLLFLPAVAPVLLAATRASEAVLASSAAEAVPWLRLLILFAAIYTLAGVTLFGALLEDS